MTELIIRLLAGLPGWEHASITPLQGGKSNRSYKVRSAGRVAVLKMDPGPRDWPGNSRSREAGIQSVAAASDLAAAVLWHSDNGILTAWLEGQVLDRTCLTDHGMLERVGRALCAVHSLPATGRRVKLADWADYYRQQLRQIGNFDAEARAACKRIQGTTLPGRVVFSHNDLVPGNIVNGDRLRFIDWEYAGDNSWLFDLATLYVEAGLDDAAGIALCRGYTGLAEMPRGFEEAVAVYRALLALWNRANLPVVA